MWKSFAFLFVAGCVIAVVSKLWRTHIRLKRLRETGRILAWMEFHQNPNRYQRMIVINFGFGTEVWASPNTDPQIDLELKAFGDGVLIQAPPRKKALEEFCR